MDKLAVPGELTSLGAIRDFVRASAMAAGIDKTATYRLCLAVDEIASNIVMHGYDEAGKHGDITVRAEVDANVLRIQIEDTGATYDVSQYEDPENLHRTFSSRTEGGLGVYLAIQGVDRFNYETEDGRNRHTFEVNLTRSAAHVQ
jgi:anti-sigma regulatory factor (Ser/Thr protein kinase)